MHAYTGECRTQKTLKVLSVSLKWLPSKYYKTNFYSCSKFLEQKHKEATKSGVTNMICVSCVNVENGIEQHKLGLEKTRVSGQHNL